MHLHWGVGCQTHGPRPRGISADRKQSGCQSVSGPELGAEASFLSISCHWGPLQERPCRPGLEKSCLSTPTPGVRPSPRSVLACLISLAAHSPPRSA